jgi:hypothetical protein
MSCYLLMSWCSWLVGWLTAVIIDCGCHGGQCHWMVSWMAIINILGSSMPQPCAVSSMVVVSAVVPRGSEMTKKRNWLSTVDPSRSSTGELVWHLTSDAIQHWPTMADLRQW